MNKSELVAQAAMHSGISKKDAEAVADALLDALRHALVSGEKVTITNFGTFEVKKREARVGRNPRTHEVVAIPPANTPVFRPCPSLKKAVEEKGDNYAS